METFLSGALQGAVLAILVILARFLIKSGKKAGSHMGLAKYEVSPDFPGRTFLVNGKRYDWAGYRESLVKKWVINNDLEELEKREAYYLQNPPIVGMDVVQAEALEIAIEKIKSQSPTK